MEEVLSEVEFTWGVVGVMVYLVAVFIFVEFKWRWLTVLAKGLVVVMLIACVVTLGGVWME